LFELSEKEVALSRLPTISLFAVLALASSPVLGAAKEQQLNFSVDPAELATAEGVAKLHERIISFAKGECRSISNPPMRNPRAEQCTKTLVDQLVAQIDSPLLTAYAERGVTVAIAE
jgi:UrcA family protein